MKNVKALFVLGIFTVLAFAAMQPLFAGDPPSGVKIRADDGDVWRIWDNPALLHARRDAVVFGLRASSLQDVFSGGGSQPKLDLAFASPALAYGLSYDGLATDYRVGTAVGFGKAFSVGYSSRYSAAPAVGFSGFNIGALIRPADFCSFGLVYDAAANGNPVWGLGVGLRPLVFATGLAPVLTLTADARYDGGFTLESAGAKIAIADILKLRGWWDFEKARPGAELSLSFAFSETGAGTAAATDPLKTLWAGQTVKVPRYGTPMSIPGKKILVFKDLAAISTAPTAAPVFAFINPERSIDVPTLCGMIRQAADDPSVAAVLFQNLPAMAYPAAIQEIAEAVDDLKTAGKGFYVYADNIDDPNVYGLLLAKADHIALNPNGMALVLGWGTTNFYFKNMFERIGIRFVNWAPWPTKSANNPLTEAAMPPEERAMVQRWLGELETQTEAALDKARGAKLAATAKETVAKGPYFRADAALKAGLVDSLEYRADYEEALKKQIPGAVFAEALPDSEADSWGPSLLTKKVALVWCVGNIEDAEGGLAGQNINQTTAEEIKKLREDPFVAGILLRVDSGGGSALVSDIIADEVRKTVAAGKPVAVSMGDLAASGGYYISAYAERIFANPGSITGSIGVTGAGYNFQGLIDKLGIKAETVSTSPSSLFQNPFENPRPEDAALIKEYILSVYDRFIAVVAAGRKLDPDKVRAIGEGRIWTGREALELGLVDELGGLEKAKAWMEKRLGGQVEFADVFPGLDKSLMGMASRGMTEAVDYLGIGKTGVVAALDELAGPALKRLTSILRMGQGALYYCPEALGF